MPAPAAEPSFEPSTPAYPDINHDFKPEAESFVERRSPDSPLRTRTQPDAQAPDAEQEQDVFKREMASLAAMAPIQNDFSDTPPPMPKETAPAPAKSSAQEIEDDLMRFHDLDLLSESAG